MESYIYQVQRRTRNGWEPCFRFNSPKCLEFKDLDRACNEARLLAAKYSGIRVAKIETYLIKQFS